MVILAHHEIGMQVLQYGLSLILGGYICFKHLFPMLGRWIVDLNRKMQEKMRSDGQRNRQWLKKLMEDKDKQRKEQLKRFEDDQCVIDGLYMDENDIEECSDSLKHI